MPSPLILGGKKKSGDAFQVDTKALQAHTCIVGRSGCGKTTLIARYIEEIVLREAGNVLLLDYNHEFSHFNEVKQEAFDNGKDHGVMGLCPEDTLAQFQAAWAGHQQGMSSVKAQQMRVPFDELSADGLAYLLGVDAQKDPGAYWMVRLLVEENSQTNCLKKWDDLRQRVRTFERWAEGRRRASEHESEETAHQVESLTTRLDHARLRNGVASSEGGKYLAFTDGETVSDATLFNGEFFAKLLGSQRFTALDLLNFKYDEYRVRGFIILHVLRSLWNAATDRFRTARESNRPVGAPPLFLIIDEAHNLIRAGESNPIINVVETIAAEGRKFGLFLVLISQRPDKISEKVISECENFVVMRSAPGVVQFLRKKLSVGGSKGGLGKKVESLATGHAVFYGRFTDERMEQINGSFRRTK